MITFSEYIVEAPVKPPSRGDLMKAMRKRMSPSARRKKAMIFPKTLSKRLRAKKRYANRMPPKKVLEKRAYIMARKFVIKRKKLLAPDLIKKYPGKLTIPQKMSIEMKLKKHGGLIKKLSKKFVKIVKRNITAKMQARKQSKQGVEGDDS